MKFFDEKAKDKDFCIEKYGFFIEDIESLDESLECIKKNRKNKEDC